MNYTVIALNDATLRCTTAVDNVKYSWHRANGVMPSGSIGLNKSTLTIPRAIPPDMGVYYCIISKDRVTVESDRATLDVNGKLLLLLLLLLAAMTYNQVHHFRVNHLADFTQNGHTKIPVG